MGMRAFSASSTMMKATAAKIRLGSMTDRGARVAVHEARQRGASEEQRRIEEHHQQRGFGEEADHHFAARPERAERGADVHGGERDEDARRGEEAHERDRVRRAAKGRSVPSEGMMAAASTMVPNTT